MTPPYPADTRARGWRFELDYERIEQADTWSLAADIPMAQHALLMMWMVSWSQTPCGSMPNDEAIIRAKCRIPAPLWSKGRSIFMRGWWLASDGRLYHDTIIARVRAMLDKRASDAERAANRRARKADERLTPVGVTGESRVTQVVVGPEFDTKHQAPTKRLPPASRGPLPSTADDPPMTFADLEAEGVDAKVARDWLKVRKAKKAPLTRTAWEGVKREAVLAGMTPAEAVKHAAEMSWQGFKAAWLKRDLSSGATQSFRERDLQSAALKLSRLTGNMANVPVEVDHNQETIDVTAIEVHGRRLA